MLRQAESTVTLADEIVRVLSEHGVKYIFGYPGAAILTLMDAVRKSEVRWILTRNETAAALAASAHAKVTGQLAVCFATSGPGATNLVTGLIDAQCDGASVLAITGQIPTWRQGRSEFQDVDSARILADALPYSVQCEHPDQLAPMLRDCIRTAEQMHCVVHMAIAADVQSFSPGESDTRFPLQIERQIRLQQPACDASLDLVAKELSSCGEIVLAVGPRADGAGRAIERLADKLNAPIITSFGGKGIIDENHRCSLGVLGIFGAPGEAMAQRIVSGADAIVAFGLSEVGPFVCGADGVQKRKLFDIEPYFRAITHRYLRSQTLVADLSEIADELMARVEGGQHRKLLAQGLTAKEEFEREWNRVDLEGKIHQAAFFRDLTKVLPGDAIVTFDIGDNAVWAAQFLKLRGNHKVIVSDNLGVMGFALPAAIAAKLEHKDRPVVAIAGDGGFQMTLHELATAMEEKLEIVVVVIENNILGRVYSEQKTKFGTTLVNPNFEALARAYGCGATTISKLDQIADAFRAAFNHQGSPFLISVQCDSSVLAPMSKWKDGFVPAHFS